MLTVMDFMCAFIAFYFFRHCCLFVVVVAAISVLLVEWRESDINFMCDWVLCVPHRYYYCFPINVGEQSISIVIHPSAVHHTQHILAHTHSNCPNFLYLTQNTRYGSFCIFSASKTCICTNVTKHKSERALASQKYIRK